MRSSELARIEAARDAERPPPRRVGHRDVTPEKVRRNVRAEVEQEFRDSGARVWREDTL